jgi:hypothetical protein
LQQKQADSGDAQQGSITRNNTKHEGMNEKLRLQNGNLNGTPRTARVTRLLRRAQDCLRNAQGNAPTHRELGEWTQTAHATVTDWFNNKGRPTAEFLFQLLERLPEEKRQEMIESACRAWPSLGNPRLKCDQTVISLLKTIVCLPRGLVLVQGGNDENRTFVITAMGNAFLDLTARPHRLSGIDIHEPDWFVPLPGVCYLHNILLPAKVVQAVREYWPSPPAHGAHLVVLNGLEAVMAHFGKQVRALSARCPVIIAETGIIKPALLKRCSAGPIHIITVGKHSENSKGIAVAVEAI